MDSVLFSSMRWPAKKRTLAVYLALATAAIAVCGWQVQEHAQFQRGAQQALINRGRDITSTLGVIMRAQRRFGMVISKDRLESALQDLLHPGELVSIAILGSTGEPIASAGQPVQVTPEMLQARGTFWRDRTVTIMNLMDLGANAVEDGSRPASPTIVVSDERPFRPTVQRRRTAVNKEGANPAPGTDTTKAGAAPAAAEAGPQTGPPLFGRPSWMSPEEYDTIIQKQGVHSLVIAMSTDDMRRAVQNDLVLRSLVSLLAIGAVVVSGLAWRNLHKNAELQIRLVKAGEMNTHLREMNFAAAGLAHETRNPLNLIRGLAQMIAKAPEAPAKLKEHAATIQDEADRVTVQLNEFINYSKPREVHFAPVDVPKLVADLARTLLPDLEEKRIQFIPPSSALRIEADEPLLRQALFNVILNATQAVEPGGRIEVRLEPADGREAVLDIRDNGPGVPAEHRATIFKPYVTMKPKGVGLGLAIVAQIASAHHWEVACLANEPRGAVFRFSHLKIAA